MGESILRGGGSPSDSAFARELRKGIGLKFLNRDVAADGNVRESGDVGGGLGKRYLFCLTAPPPRNSLCRGEGMSQKGPRNPGKRSGSGGWARGPQSRPRRLSVACSSCSRGESGSSRAGRGTGWERPPRGPSPGVEQSTQNWHRPRELYRLNKTKHCDGPCGCSR